MTKPMRIDTFRDADSVMRGVLVDGKSFEGLAQIDMRVGGPPIVKLNGTIVENCDVYWWENPTLIAAIRQLPKSRRR
jgi:hypothetical protein